MRRARLLLAVGVSLVLHGALGLWVWRRDAAPVRAESTRVRAAPLVVEILPPTPRREPPPPVPVPPPPAPARPLARGPARARPPPEVAAPPPPSVGPPVVEAPRQDVPRAVRLFPGAGGLPVAPAAPGASASSEPPALTEREQERVRVTERVQGFVADELATERVENGLVDSYFGEMDRALEKGLTGAPLFSYEGVLKHFFKPGPAWTEGLNAMKAEAQAYGAWGAPDAVGGPLGTDRLQDVARSGAAGARARTGTTFADRVDAYSRGASALRVQVELEQSPSGRVLGVKLLESSHNPLFDTYVLENVPKALAALGPASEHFAQRSRAPTVRSVWSVAGRVSFTRTVKVSELPQLGASDAAYFSALGVLGVLSGGFDEVRGEVYVPDLRQPHFDIQTRLLRVY